MTTDNVPPEDGTSKFRLLAEAACKSLGLDLRTATPHDLEQMAALLKVQVETQAAGIKSLRERIAELESQVPLELF